MSRTSATKSLSCLDDSEAVLPVVSEGSKGIAAERDDRAATAFSLRRFFHPRSVAVIGASRDPASIGHRLFEALIQNGFEGSVFPVNPKATAIGSVHAYPSLQEVPEPVELAIIAVPREAVLPVVDECAACGVRALIVISAGFAEVGTEGRELQEKLMEKVRRYGQRLIGPNCLGLLSTDPHVRLNASFGPYFRDVGISPCRPRVERSGWPSWPLPIVSTWASPVLSASAIGPTFRATTSWSTGKATLPPR